MFDIDGGKSVNISVEWKIEYSENKQIFQSGKS